VVVVVMMVVVMVMVMCRGVGRYGRPCEQHNGDHSEKYTAGFHWLS
jgi:hypothetical protein